MSCLIGDAAVAFELIQRNLEEASATIDRWKEYAVDDYSIVQSQNRLHESIGICKQMLNGKSEWHVDFCACFVSDYVEK